ncbi:MAG: hypothetical protein ABEJ99_05165 [Candidatus Nanohaloarchaea archaeon]
MELEPGWMKKDSEERKSLFEMNEDESESLLEDAESKIRGYRIESVANYMAENIPGYEETRGMPAIVGEASVVVDRTFDNDYRDIYGRTLMKEMLSDAGYSLSDR